MAMGASLVPTVGPGGPGVQCIALASAIRYADGLVELDHVEAFVAIVRRGGFSRAAAALHLSQSAISRRVHLLEDELGAPLFDRVRSGATLTDAGRAFLPPRPGGGSWGIPGRPKVSLQSPASMSVCPVR